MSLPQRTLRRLREFTFMDSVLLLVFFSILIVSFAFFFISMDEPYMGVRLELVDSRWEVSSLDQNGQAVVAGIEAGDIPIVINGQPADSFLSVYHDEGIVFSGLIRELTVVDAQKTVKTARLDGGEPSASALFEILTLFILCLLSWVVGLYVFLKKPGQASTRLFSFCAIVFGLSIAGNMAALRGISIAAHLEVIASMLGPWLLFHFFLVLPEERVRLRSSKWLYMIYLPSILCLLFYPFFGYAHGQAIASYRDVRYFIFGIGLVFAIVTVIVNFFTVRSPVARQQMKIILFSCLAASIPLLTLNIVPEVFTGTSIIPVNISVVFFGLIPLGMGYAVINKKLMDIDVYIRRGFVYGLITLFMTIVLSMVTVAILMTRQQVPLDIITDITLAIALAIIATTLFVPLKKFSEFLIDKYIYKDRYNYPQLIQALSTYLNGCKDTTEAARYVVGTVMQSLNLSGACVFLKQQNNTYEIAAAQGTITRPEVQKDLSAIFNVNNVRIFPDMMEKNEHNIAFNIPLKTSVRDIGKLCITSKSTRQDFNPDDIYLLNGIASVSASALQSTILIHDVSVRDTFVSIVSHELRNPITNISGYSEMLLNNPAPEKRQKWAGIIYENSQHVARMIDELLDVTRIQSGRATFNIESIDILDCLQEIISIMQESTDKHTIRVRPEINLPNVLADRGKLSHIVGNLISNAIKYSPNGGDVVLSIYKHPDKNRVIVCVADKGIGIDIKDRELLFTTFHRIQRPETAGIRGSGLGLYIAKEWIEAMGGEIWLESELHMGSKFYISIPSA